MQLCEVELQATHSIVRADLARVSWMQAPCSSTALQQPAPTDAGHSPPEHAHADSTSIESQRGGANASALDLMGANEANKLLQKGVRLFSVPYTQALPRIDVQQEDGAVAGSVSQFKARTTPHPVEWVPSADCPLQTRSLAPAVVHALGSSAQEARTAASRALLKQWSRAGLLADVGGELRFTGHSPYIPFSSGVGPARRTVHVPSFISKDDMLQLPLRRHPGEPQLIQDAERAGEVLASIVQRARSSTDPDDRIVGFDVEWRPSHRPGTSNPPAIVQVASSTEVFVIQLTAFRPRQFDPHARTKDALDCLAPLLEDPSIQKCGAGVLGDIQLLQRWNRDLEARSMVDLQSLAEELQFRVTSLGALCCLVLGFRISKAQRMSNWELPRLTPAQISYAATDAWVSRELAVKMLQAAT